jgi:prophage tail gpP-like protein
MTSYRTVSGDTLERVSTIAYGTEEHSERIRVANPELEGGLVPGMVLVIPEIPGDSRPAVLRETASSPNAVSLRINGAVFQFWNEIKLESAIDSFSMFSFTTPFEPDSPELRELFRPFEFQRVEILIGGELQFTGTLMTPTPTVAPDSATAMADGYALAGVLNDCPLPGAVQPVEYNGLTLKTIAQRQAESFGLAPVFDTPQGLAFESVTIQDGQAVLAFWKMLATKRGIVISNDEFGQPVFQTETDETEAQPLELGRPPVASVSPSFDAQAYYSHITVVSPMFLGIIEGARHTEVNPFLRGVSRPLTISVEDLEPGEEVALAKSKMGRMFANAISYHVTVDTWRDAAGALWRPNTFVELLAPRAMVYNPTRFLIRSVSLRKEKAETATLNCVLPGAYSGGVPEALPWSE